jgi:hypothetical protein
MGQAQDHPPAATGPSRTADIIDDDIPF